MRTAYIVRYHLKLHGAQPVSCLPIVSSLQINTTSLSYMSPKACPSTPLHVTR